MQHYDQPEIVNVGTGEDVTIADLAKLIARSAGYHGELSSTLRSPTARLASFWTSAAFMRSAGVTPSLLKTEFAQLTNGF